jgi:hypothetical protein
MTHEKKESTHTIEETRKRNRKKQTKDRRQTEDGQRGRRLKISEFEFLFFGRVGFLLALLAAGLDAFPASFIVGVVVGALVGGGSRSRGRRRSRLDCAVLRFVGLGLVGRGGNGRGNESQRVLGGVFNPLGNEITRAQVGFADRLGDAVNSRAEKRSKKTEDTR